MSRALSCTTLLGLAGMSVLLLARGAREETREAAPLLRARQYTAAAAVTDPRLPRRGPPPPAIGEEELTGIQQDLREADREAWALSWVPPEYERLVADLMDRVPFPGGMVEVERWARKEYLTYAPGVLEKTVRARLTAPEGGAWRRRLAAWVPPDSGAAGVGWNWFVIAGRASPPGEYGALAAAVKDPDMKGFLELGRNMTLVHTAPAEAVATTLALMRRPEISRTAFDFLPALMKQLPANTDFAAIARLIPADAGWTMDSTREALRERRAEAENGE